MKTTRMALLLAVAASLLLGGATATQAQVKDWKEIKSPALKAFTIPEPERYVMKNGMVVMLIENHELPLIEVSARIRTGSRLEPADKVGLAGLTGSVLRTGGAKGRTGDEIDDWLDGRGARIETAIGRDAGTANASCLKADFPDLVQLLADILRSPSFEEAKLKVAKTQSMAGISRRNDNPLGIMFRESTKLVYGADSPYARTTEYATIGAITQGDLKAFHAKYYMPNRTLLGVTGDFNSAEMKTLLEKTFGDWQKGPVFKDTEAAYSKTPKPGLYRIVKTDMTQSDVMMAHLGIRQDNPDFFALEVMNQVLSGSFASRLFSNVRTKKGLAYAVSGEMGANFDYPGTFNVWVTTKTETTAAAIDALLEEVDGIVSRPATDDEVTRAKQSILNSFIFNYDSKGKILRQQLLYEYFGYPRDFLAKYRDNIDKVTTAEVVRVSKAYVKKNDLSILVVGKSDGVDRPLESFGKVAEVSIAIPEPASAPSAVAATPGMTDAQAVSKGAELVKKLIAAIGGAEKIDGVKSLRVVDQTTMTTPRGEMEVKGTRIFVYPDKVRQDVTTPMGAMTMVATGADAFINTPMGLQPMPDPRRAEMIKTLKRNPVLLMKHRTETGFSARYEGTNVVNSVKADVLAVTYDGDTVRFSLDPTTGRILSVASKGTGPTGVPGQMVSIYSDYRDVSGLMLPYSTKVTVDGEPLASSVAEEVTINAAVDDSQFARPTPATASTGGE